MSIRINWNPNTDADIAAYDIETATFLEGPFTLLVTVTHNLAGPAFDPDTGKFFYEHLAGTPTTYYRLKSVDVAGNRSLPTTAFQVPSTAPDVSATVRVDHNYGAPAALRYQTIAGQGIEGAVIRVFTKTAFDTGDTEQAVAVTSTNARGDWVSPVYLPTGFTYTVLFYKDGLYGPDTREIVV